MFEPVFEYCFSYFRKHAFRVVLNASDVIFPVAERHDIAFITGAGNLQACGEVVSVHNPRVVTSHLYGFVQTLKDIVICTDMGRSGYSVEDAAQVGKLAAKDFSYGLMPQAYAKDGFLAGIGADNIKQQTGFAGNARTGRENDLIELLQIRKLELVVPENRDLRSQFLYQMR